MAYSKLPRVPVNYGLGFQTINTAAGNTHSLYDLYVVKHGRKSTGRVWEVFGHHNDPTVPRAVCRTAGPTSGIDGSTPFNLPTASIATPVGSIYPRRLSSGQYEIQIGGLGRFRSHCTVESGSGTPVRLIQTRFSPASATITLISVSTLELNSGTTKFEFFDCNFHLVVYGDL